jgi:bifunctional non-homologous end joining protein LigD
VTARAKKAAPVDIASIPGIVRAPVPNKLEPQLATLAKDPPAGDGWLHEIKFDGYRMLAHIAGGKTAFISRNGLDWSAKFPELATLLAALPVGEAVLDGEVCHVLPTGVTSFGALQNDLSDKRTAQLVFFAFDLLYLDGYRIDGAALIDRKERLAALLKDASDPRLQFSAHQVGQGAEFFAAAAAIPLEGIVSKLASGPYRPGRGPGWLKIKAIGREELIVVGFTDPEGARTGFGALLLGYYNPDGVLTYAGKVGTGYSDKLLRTLRAKLDALGQPTATVTLPKGISRTGVHWVKPQIVVETSFTEWTSDGVLRHPSFLGLREDKAAREVVLSKTLNPEVKTTHWAKKRGK